MKKEKIMFETDDKIVIRADLYKTQREEAPLILLFHQANLSRKEYKKIAPKLTELGFNCMAIDQRSGKNKTNKMAVSQGKAVEYKDAYVDLEAALNYAKENIKRSKIIIWGSSYSALLVFVLAEKYEKDIHGIVAFSPADYFQFNGKSVEEYGKAVKCPIFITSSKSECIDWKEIYDQVSVDNKVGFIPTKEGRHGSRVLLNSTMGHEEYWDALRKFLVTFV